MASPLVSPTISGVLPSTATVPASVSDYSSSNPASNIAWVQQAFLLPNENASKPDISADDYSQRLFTTAAFNFTDTTPGGNWAINPAPQFCRYADVTMGGDAQYVQGRFSSDRTTLYTQGGFGEGRYYKEIYDDNAQFVTMSFGIPAFNSLSSFFGNFYDDKLGTLVRTGRLPGILFQAGYLTGSLLALPFKPLILVSQIIKSARNIPSSSYAYFQPNMTLYWETVTTMVNSITANLGLHSRELTPAQKLMYIDPNGSASGVGATNDLASDISKLHKFLPQIYVDAGTASPNGYRGGIDVYAMASRAQNLSYQFYKQMQGVLDKANNLTDLRTQMTALIAGKQTLTPAKSKSLSQKLQDYFKGVFTNSTQPAYSGSGWPAGDVQAVTDSGDQAFVNGFSDGTPPAESQSGGNTATDLNAAPQPGASGTTSTTTPDGGEGKSTGIINAIEGWFANFVQGLSSDLQDGSQYVTFKVDYGGPIGESFGNSMRPSDLQEQFNSKVSASRNTQYNMANGKLVGGAIGGLIQGAKDMVNSVVSGVLAGVSLSGLMALKGTAFVDIPQMYDTSTATLPSQSFTIHLRSPYGHKLALLQNLYIPLAMLLAAVLPRATGPASYGTPFCCQLFAQGRMQVRYGMVTSLSVQRGTGNIGFTQNNLPLGIDVTFEVTDFSSVLYMPVIAQTGFLDKLTMGLGEVIGGLTGAAVGAISGTGTGSAASGAQTGEDIASAFTSGMYSDDSVFSDYMAVLAGLSFTDQIYPFRKWSISRDAQELNYDMAKSPYHWALMVNGSLPGRVISGLVRGTDRP